MTALELIIKEIKDTHKTAPEDRVRESARLLAELAELLIARNKQENR